MARPCSALDWDGAADFLRRYQSFLLCAHQKPDADTIGSVPGAGARPGRAGQARDPGLRRPPQRVLATLPGAERFLTAVPDGETYEAIVALDASTLERLGAIPLATARACSAPCPC